MIAENAGYPALFGIGTALCVAFTVLVLTLRERLPGRISVSPPAGAALG